MKDNMYIIGADEVGTGSWAGPIIIGAIRAPTTWRIPGLKDSKKLTATQRSDLTQQLLALANQGVIQCRLEISNNDEIDKFGLGACHKQCYAKAINYLYQESDKVIIDGNLNPSHFVRHGLQIDTQHVRSVIKADNTYPTVMAASIFAKHYRDNLMLECHNSYPKYEWNENVGYIVPAHKEAVKQYGLSPLHRKSYKVKL